MMYQVVLHEVRAEECALACRSGGRCIVCACSAGALLANNSTGSLNEIIGLSTPLVAPPPNHTTQTTIEDEIVRFQPFP